MSSDNLFFIETYQSNLYIKRCSRLDRVSPSMWNFDATILLESECPHEPNTKKHWHDNTAKSNDKKTRILNACEKYATLIFVSFAFAFRFAQAQPAHSPPLDHGAVASGFLLSWRLTFVYIAVY